MASSMELRLPQPLDCSNLSREWPKWKQIFSIYLIATNKMNEPEQNKIATFLWLVGNRGVEIYNSLFPNDGSFDGMFGTEPGMDEEEEADGERGDVNHVVVAAARRTLCDVIKAFDDYCLPKKNITMEAFKFNAIRQSEKQSFSSFETELRTQVQFCEYECTNCHTSYADRMLRDRIIVGVEDKVLQLKLLDGRDNPLHQVVEMCKVYETAAANKQLLDRNGAMEVKTVMEQAAVSEPQKVELVKRSCFNCGQPFDRQHRQQCPAKEIKCRRCGIIGHYQRFCKSSDGGREYRAPRDGSNKFNIKNVRSIDWRNTE
ncbi:uncharacterized protein LOC129748930 [Uranotaenia lowii]|uniref:uncharacterized protein LOC129748930 n=1 Tax=Uranotaenia lowii TaxID=190385 RepID=UPI002479EF85|nr:uncharacterized protein LOC129748930 [Uranotaenia lowii]